MSQSYQQMRENKSPAEVVKMDHELIDFVYKHKINKLWHMIAYIVVAVVVLIIMAAITGAADQNDNKSAAGFFGNWVMLSALVILGIGSYIGYVHYIKSKTQFSQQSIFDLKKCYDDVLTAYVKQSEFAKYVADHKDEKDCIGRALVHKQLEVAQIPIQQAVIQQSSDISLSQSQSQQQ